MKNTDKVRWLVVTFCGLGLAPVASGTFGTLGGVLLAVLTQLWLDGWQYLVAIWGLAAGLFLAGCETTNFVRRTFDYVDPKQFVLDEVVGYLITIGIWALCFGEPSPLVLAIAFVAFRATDVLKLPPADRLEYVPGALGVMLDDVAAGVQAGLLMLATGWLGLR